MFSKLTISESIFHDEFTKKSLKNFELTETKLFYCNFCELILLTWMFCLNVPNVKFQQQLQATLKENVAANSAASTRAAVFPTPQLRLRRIMNTCVVRLPSI